MKNEKELDLFEVIKKQETARDEMRSRHPVFILKYGCDRYGCQNNEVFGSKEYPDLVCTLCFKLQSEENRVVVDR
jgi:hypothetical protein